jgi:hypothetical protein
LEHEGKRKRARANGRKHITGVIPSASVVILNEDARSSMECGSEAGRSCRLPPDKKKAVAVRRLTDAALQGASRIFVAKNLRNSLRIDSPRNVALRTGRSGARGEPQVMRKRESGRDSSLHSE